MNKKMIKNNIATNKVTESQIIKKVAFILRQLNQ